MPSTPPPDYAELHCISNFRFLRGASPPEKLVNRAHEPGYTALALTDEYSLACIVRAHLAARKARLPLILGNEFRFDHTLHSVCDSDDPFADTVAGFSLHAGVATKVHERDKLERLCRSSPC